MDRAQAEARVRALPIWQGRPRLERISGGRTNLNFKVTDRAGSYVARLGEDLPHHQVLRFNELAASRAAHAAGISPRVVHAENGLTVIDFIEGKTFQESDIRAPENRERIVNLLHKCHISVAQHLRGPVLIFWVFHVIRDYAATLAEGGSPHAALVPEFLALNAELEAAAGPFDIVFGHNDLVADNILDDGEKLWLIDWDYAGFNTPLFDLGGLSSNNGLSPEAERDMLELYFDRPADDALFHRYFAMKTASILREAMWSMVSEMTSTLDVDYAAYTAENLARFRAVHADYQNL